MKLIDIDPDFIVHRKYFGAAELLRPVLFWNGSQYCCLLETNQMDLMTVADTPVKALKAWNNALILRLQEADETDYIVKYVNNIIQEVSKPENVQNIVNKLYRVI